MIESGSERGSVYTDRIRKISHEIVNTSTDLLTIDYDTLRGSFLSKVKEYQNKLSNGPDPFAENSLTLENELGLNLFLDVVNFCYRNPFAKKDYIYVNREGKSITRANGLKAAMVESGVNWGNIKEVAGMTAADWSKIIQLDNNKDFYLGNQRGLRISSFAALLSRIGSKNISDVLDYCKYDTETMLTFLSDTGYFTDIFQKRSQLAVNMIDQVLQRRSGQRIKGTEMLTVMADYRLPQLGYNLGPIKLLPPFENILLDETVIMSESRKELALRSACVVMGEETSKLLGISEGRVDSLFWKMAIDMAKAGQFTIPHMLVATDQY